MFWASIRKKATNFDLNEIKPIKNDNELINKPIGGLWTSPYQLVNDYSDWIRWCKYNKPTWIPDNGVVITLKSNTIFCVINSPLAYLNCPRLKNEYGFKQDSLNFEKLSKDYDVLWVKPWNLWRFDKEIGYVFNAWDVETVLIMNPSIIESWKLIPICNTDEKN